MKLRFFLLAALFCAGCTPAHTPPPAPTPQVTPASASKQITLDWTPKTPRSLDPIQFTVRVFDVQGQPQTAKTVTLGLAMPTMDMGKNDVSLKPTGPGVYTGTGRLTMAGGWWATVTVHTGGTVKATVVPITAE